MLYIGSNGGHQVPPPPHKIMIAFTEQQQIDETYIPTEQDWEDVFAEESKFMFNCWNPTERLQVIVTLMATTAQEAVETFTRLNPDLQVINWDLADHMI